MRLRGNFKIDFVGVERIKYEIDGQTVEGREIAFRSEQKYGNLKANKEAVEALEAAKLAPFTPVEVTITLDTDVNSSRNYRVTEVFKDGRKLYAPDRDNPYSSEITRSLADNKAQAAAEAMQEGGSSGSPAGNRKK